MFSGYFFPPFWQWEQLHKHGCWFAHDIIGSIIILAAVAYSAVRVAPNFFSANQSLLCNLNYINTSEPVVEILSQTLHSKQQKKPYRVIQREPGKNKKLGNTVPDIFHMSYVRYQWHCVYSSGAFGINLSTDVLNDRELSSSWLHFDPNSSQSAWLFDRSSFDKAAESFPEGTDRNWSQSGCEDSKW